MFAPEGDEIATKFEKVRIGSGSMGKVLNSKRCLHSYHLIHALLTEGMILQVVVDGLTWETTRFINILAEKVGISPTRVFAVNLSASSARSSIVEFEGMAGFGKGKRRMD